MCVVIETALWCKQSLNKKGGG